MPKIIKFRIWDTRLQKMTNYHIWSQLDDPEYIFMQFVGFSDMNGKDIYEGDIVTLWYGNYPFGSGKFEVIFERGCFCLKAIKVDGLAGLHFPSAKTLSHLDENDDPVWHNDRGVGGVQPLYNFGKGIIEVIGNKFENKNIS